ncbi:MAG: hypothetical protein QM723_05040 [Myxococcaceae bacterium]
MAWVVGGPPSPLLRASGVGPATKKLESIFGNQAQRASSYFAWSTFRSAPALFTRPSLVRAAAINFSNVHVSADATEAVRKRISAQSDRKRWGN